jgi:hypothetical protein
MNIPKIYISGAITGMPNLNRERFKTATETLRALGFTVVNPHEICQGIPAEDWSLCMRKCIIELMYCDMMVMLDGWQLSKGATLEFNLAVQLGIKPISLSVYIETLQG